MLLCSSLKQWDIVSGQSLVSRRNCANVDAKAGKLGFLTIKRKCIEEFGDKDMRLKARHYDALWNDLRRQRRNLDRTAQTPGLTLDALAVPAGALVADVALDLDVRRHNVQLFADVLADPGQGAAAHANLLGFGQVMNNGPARQLGREWPTARPFRLCSGETPGDENGNPVDGLAQVVRPWAR